MGEKLGKMLVKNSNSKHSQKFLNHVIESAIDEHETLKRVSQKANMVILYNW